MTRKERLAKIAGVWEGTYTHLTPEGKVLDQYASRQECRLEGDDWYERIIYQWPDGREQTLDFRARFAGEDLVFEDARFHGESFRVTDEISIFAYYWKERPQVRIVETIVCDLQDRKSRVWQTFEDGELVKVTVIVERRADGTPTVWH
jgi:hypothetical protein